MAKKRFLQENGNQIWPITRMDCVYTEDGKNLANLYYASKDFVLDDCLGGKKMRYVTIEEYDNLTDEQKNDEGIIWNITDAEITDDLHYASEDFVLDDCLGGKKLRYVTTEEYNNLTDEQKNDESIIWNITDSEIITVATPDWNETDETSPSYIANKPDLTELGQSQIDNAELDSMLFDVFGIEPEIKNNN